MKKLLSSLVVTALISAAAFQAQAIILVSNVWNTGVRTYPAYNDPNSPYSEMGVDYNNSGDLESSWFNANGTMAAATGNLTTTLVGTGSASWTTYFTTPASPVSLVNAGDALTITWVFTPSGVNSASTSSSGLRVAVVSSQAATRLTSDGSPGSATYAGYGIFMNIATTLGSGTPFELMTRSAPGTASAFLSSSGSWTGLGNGATSGHTGYASGTQYTLAMTFTRNSANGLNIVATMSGGSLNNTGSATISYTDNAPNSFTFDTFGIRPSDATDSASSFDTTLFMVQATTSLAPPSVTTDPQDQNVYVGQSATFSVLAAGSSPLSYQWFYDTNTPVSLAGATNSTVTLTNLQTTNSDNYFVVITNSVGSVTSDVAALVVTAPDAASIITQPQDQYITPGGNATFSVLAGGSEPLTYQWYYNTNTLLTNANNSTFTITNVSAAVAGSYSVTVSNLAGGITSMNAFLTINTTPVAPGFSSQPDSQVVLIGGTAIFSASASGTGPISYQWSKNGVPISGATSTTLTLTNVQITDDGSYTITASNNVGSATTPAAVLTVTTTVPVANSAYDLTGFGNATTGGGVVAETDPAYVKVTNALDLANALVAAYKTAGAVKVIEITTNMDLGWNEIGTTVQNLASTPFRANTTPLMHPRLLVTGVSLLDIKPRSGLTIFSANGATIKHVNFNVKSTANIIIRNLKFDELWEWDEATKGQYDRNDWDFMTLGNGGAVSNIWIDHCTFTKSYDGVLDTKAGCSDITISWCSYIGDDGATNTNSWVRQQINSLESSLSTGTNTMYSFLRNNGFTAENIIDIDQAHDKTHLAGQNDLDPDNATISMTFHHLWLNGVWDRCVPRLRAGNVHDYNIYVNDTLVMAAKNLRESIVSAMSLANQNTINNTYDFDPPVNGAISTEGGALLLEKSVYVNCLWPLRNNQTDPSNPEYTGKIESLDTIYQFGSTVVRGNSTDAGNPMGPVQAPVIPFSWNLPNNQLPYAYTPDDPAQLPAIVTSPTAGAGAGVLTWNKTNWLMTTYPATAPFVVAQPQNASVSTGQSAVFTILAGGSGPLFYQWYFNTNTPVTGATNSVLALTNIQSVAAGFYSVIVTNSAGLTNSAGAQLTVSSGASGQPQLSNLVFTNGVLNLTVNGGAGTNYVVQASTNLVDWINLFTNQAPFNWSDTGVTNFRQRFYRVQTGN